MCWCVRIIYCNKLLAVNAYQTKGIGRMRELIYVVATAQGLHARPAALLAQCCVELKSTVTVKANGKTAEGSNVLQLLSLNAKEGDEVTVRAEGLDEEEAIKKISEILKFRYEGSSRSDTLKIAFFGTKDYDRTFFDGLVREKVEGGYNVDIDYYSVRLTGETAFLAKGHEAVCIFVNDEAPASVINVLGEMGVRLILLRCAGFNNVDLKAAEKHGITVLRVPAYSPFAVAEHAMAILQQANRRLHKAYNKVKDNNFALSGLLGLDLHNKTAGILGTGRIGQCMAQICKGYGMNVIAWDAFPSQALVDNGLLTYVSKEELFRKSDLISLHAPLVMGEGGTYHLLNRKTMGQMKDGAMLVNTSRGPLIDTEALIHYLEQGKFHAVALDVYEGEDDNVYNDRSEEPLVNDVTARLQRFPNLVMTSHQAFFTREALQAIAVTTMENVHNYMEDLDYGAALVK